MRVATRILLVLLPLLLPSRSLAQAEDPSTHDRWRLGSFFAVGGGPSPSGVVGVAVERPVGDRVTLRTEASVWATGLGTMCLLVVPASPACDSEGWTVLSGVAVDAPALGPVVPYGMIMGGLNARSQGNGSGIYSAAAALEGGIRWPLLRHWSVRLGGRALHVFDRDFEEHAGEDLRYIVATIGMEYRIVRR